MPVSYSDHVARCFREEGDAGCEFGLIACPMRPMVERLALVLWAKLHPEAEELQPEDLELAHAVLESMREPSHAMLAMAGFHHRTEAERAAAKATWVTMIDMALSETDQAFTSGWEI